MKQQLDFQQAAGMLAALILERVISEIPNRPYAKLSKLVKEYQTYPLEAFAVYLNPETDSISHRRYQYLLECIPEEYRTVVRNLLDLSIFHAISSDAPEALREARISVTIETAYWLEYRQSCPAEQVIEIYQLIAPLFLKPVSPESWYAHIPMHMDCGFLDYLAGTDSRTMPLKNGFTLFTEETELPALYLYEKENSRLAEAFEQTETVFQIRGNNRSGRKFMMKHIARKCGKRVIFVDTELLLKKKEQIAENIAGILREALFMQTAVCWYHISETCFEQMTEQEFCADCIQRFQEYGIQICCCTEKTIDLTRILNAPVHIYDMPQLSEQDRIQLWQSLAEEHKAEGIVPEQFAVRFKLSCSQIAEVFQRRKFYFSASETETEKQIYEKLCARIASPSDRLFRILWPEYAFSDLILPKKEKQKIEEICSNFQCYHKVYTEWGMCAKMPYGKAISVLLCGPPGTGKTMTAHVIANQLELPLFHADLSRITDKYIGETEKHLDAIFTEAEKSDCVLLLDEADAICGKRSEVTDSKDRYANNNTAFLLQRLEQYDGIVVLSTNFINNVDNAFMRRMKYILQFSVPSADVRRQIWESCFPEKMPKAAEIDFDYLAQQFDFSGANIKNVVVAAAFLAAAEQQPVQMKHILLSIENEYMKFQKHILPGEFGKYSSLYLHLCRKG